MKPPRLVEKEGGREGGREGGGGEHTGCRCEREEGGEGEDESKWKHGALVLGWWRGI